jgi:hypothetical protein
MHSFGSDRDRALALTADAVAASDLLPDNEIQGRFFAQQCRALATAFTDRWDREAVEEGHRLAGNDPYLKGLISFMSGYGATLQCEPAQQRLLAAQTALEATTAASMHPWTIQTQGLVAMAATDLGDLQTAHEAVEAVDLLLVDAKSHTTSAIAIALVASALAAQGRLDEAATQLAVATRRMHGHGDVRLFTDLFYLIGSAALPINSDVAAQLLGYTNTGSTRDSGAAPLFTQLRRTAIDRHLFDIDGDAYRSGITLSAHGAEKLAAAAFDELSEGH